ncbi:MAG: tetratricopeptide repeat protein, partial [Bacteroidia bacterium]|nr:tetratricopeptide repeat protein [Bacteroidia bacterium]
MKSRFFNIIAICITVIVASGCASMQMRTADRFYEDLAYYNALRNYEDVAIKTQNEKAILRTAECYGLLNYNKEAEQWYSLAMEKSKVLPRHHFAYAKVLMKNGNYELAKKYLNKYLLIDRNNASIKQLISSCDSIEHFFYNDTTMYSINLLEWNELNSSSFSPRVHKSGVMFVSDRDHPQRANGTSSFSGNNTYDIFFVKLTEFDNWLQPEPIIGEVNGIFNEGPFAINASGDTMYFTRNNYLNDMPEKNADNLSTLKIYRAVFLNAEWIIDGEVSVSSSDYSVAHPTLSKNGKFLVFMSDMPWGYGGTDLYWSRKVEGKWTTPKNLGPNVNSSENEVYPYLQNDSVIYFSSGANHNMGGLDIFYSVYSG